MKNWPLLCEHFLWVYDFFSLENCALEVPNFLQEALSLESKKLQFRFFGDLFYFWKSTHTFENLLTLAWFILILGEEDKQSLINDNQKRIAEAQELILKFQELDIQHAATMERHKLNISNIEAEHSGKVYTCFYYKHNAYKHT